MKPILTRFTKHDFDGYAGALNFSNGSEPFVGRNTMLEVIADINGLCVMPFYDNEVGWGLVIESCTDSMAKVLAERVLEDTKAMFPAEIKRYIKEMGFTC